MERKEALSPLLRDLLFSCEGAAVAPLRPTQAVTRIVFENVAQVLQLVADGVTSNVVGLNVQ
jgi:hypothetical protein